MIREQDPLKQGLKLEYKAKIQGVEVIREQDPLKQGLKLRCSNTISILNQIREQDPLSAYPKSPAALNVMHAHAN